ncbi:hypothetical protein CLIM01_14858, partial [Colletotrichum limetticola]
MRFGVSKPTPAEESSQSCHNEAAPIEYARTIDSFERDDRAFGTESDEARRISSQMLKNYYCDFSTAAMAAKRRLVETGQLREAESLERNQLGDCRRCSGDIFEAMSVEARTLDLAGKHDEACAVLLGAAALTRLVWPDGNLRAMRLKNEVAVYLRTHAKFEEALHLQQEVVDHVHRLPGLEDYEPLRALHNLATMRMDLGDTDVAANSLESVLNRGIETLGEGHPDITIVMSTLAEARVRQNRLKEAASLQRTVLENARSTARKTSPNADPEKHPNTLSAKTRLACTLRYSGERDESSELFNDVYEERMETLEPVAPDMLVATMNYGTLLRGVGRPAEAEALLATVLERKREQFGNEHFHTAQPMGHLAIVYQNQGRFEDAVELLRKSHDILIRSQGKNDLDTIFVRRSLA